MAQKRPQSLCQIHAQQSNADDTERSFLQVRHDAVESVAALANSKFALDNVSVTDILILLFLCLLRPFRVLYRSFSGEIVHFVWAVAEDIQELPSVQNR